MAKLEQSINKLRRLSAKRQALIEIANKTTMLIDATEEQIRQTKEDINEIIETF